MTNLKPFNLEAALRGEPVVTKNNRKVLKIHYHDDLQTSIPVVAFVESNKDYFSGWTLYFKNGLSINGNSDNELFMAPRTKKLWIAVEKNLSNIDNIDDSQLMTHSVFPESFDTKKQLEIYLFSKYGIPLNEVSIIQIEIEV